MVAFTHFGIAAAVRKTVEQELTVKLDKVGFGFGNIKPDISPDLFKNLHIKDRSFDLVKHKIKELMDCKLDKSTKCTRQFSEKLGVVAHYIADFFCYVHSNHYKGSLLLHNVYEIGLWNYCRLNARSIKVYSSPAMTSIVTDYNALCNYIEELHNEYMTQKPSCDLDISYTLRACTSLCLSIIASCTMNQLKPVV